LQQTFRCVLRSRTKPGASTITASHMTDPACGIRQLSLPGPLLTAAAVLDVERALRAERDGRPVAIDCSALVGVTPAGLSALLELGRSAAGLRTLALTQLSRGVTLTAVQAGLGERFTIYATQAACLRAFARAEAESCER
jgi:anti-anti-sigma regulatory factor